MQKPHLKESNLDSEKHLYKISPMNINSIIIPIVKWISVQCFIKSSDMVKKKQSQSVDPSTIKTSDIRTINGWDSIIKPKLPTELQNQWLLCLTSSPYDGTSSEAVCQTLISAEKPVWATRRGQNDGTWKEWQVRNIMFTPSIEYINFGYDGNTVGYEFAYISFKILNWTTFQLRFFVKQNATTKATLYKVDGNTFTKMWDIN